MTIEIEDISQLSELVGEYESISHPALDNCQQADLLGVNRPGTRLKHLFLRDNYGRRHFLLMLAHDKQVDLKALSKNLGISRLGFASEDRLARYLKVRRGCVSVLALLNDTTHQVELWIDKDIWRASNQYQCHPWINTQTWVISHDRLKEFLAHTGHQVQLLDLSANRIL